MNKPSSNLRTVGGLTSLKVLSSIIGLAYSVLQVRYFGASAIVDAYFVATSAVYLVSSLTQGGQLAEVMLPAYLSQKKQHGSKAASNLVSAMLTRMGVGCCILLSLLFATAPLLISLMGSGLEEEFRELSIQIFRASLILIFFNVVSALVTTILNAEQVYGRAEGTAILNGICSIIILLTAYQYLGIWVLVVSLIVGKCFEFGTGYFFLKKIGYKYHVQWNTDNFDTGALFRVMFASTGYVGATQVFNVTLTSLASHLPVGIFSIYNYVQQLTTKIQGIVNGPVSTVFFSKFSKAVVDKSQGLTELLRVPILLVGTIAFLQTCFIVLLGDSILKVLWSTKAVDEYQYQIAYLMLSLNMVGVVGSSIGSIYRKAVVATNGALSIYRSLIVTQILSAIYCATAIYTNGETGLITVPLINMILMSSVFIMLWFRSSHRNESIANSSLDHLTWQTLGFCFTVMVGTLALKLMGDETHSPMMTILLYGVALLVIIAGLGMGFFRRSIFSSHFVKIYSRDVE